MGFYEIIEKIHWSLLPVPGHRVPGIPVNS